MAKRVTHCGEICLYGTHRHGAGWLAKAADGALLGDGELSPRRSFTEAVYAACEALRLRALPGCRLAYVYEPSGRLRAEVDVNRPGWYGDLKWSPAPAYVVGGEEIVRAAAEGGAR